MTPANAPAAQPPAPTPPRYADLTQLQALVGQEIGCSPWLLIEQQRIDLFGQATGDMQWIHTDPVRAAAGPFGSTVAQGFLTLSLLPALARAAFSIDAVKLSINYGLNRVRFISPVRVGSRVRARCVLQQWEPLAGGAQLVSLVTVELEGAARPACVAETVTRYYL